MPICFMNMVFEGVEGWGGLVPKLMICDFGSSNVIQLTPFLLATFYLFFVYRVQCMHSRNTLFVLCDVFGWEFFTLLETPPYPVKDYKFRRILDPAMVYQYFNFIIDDWCVNKKLNNSLYFIYKHVHLLQGTRNLNLNQFFFYKI